MALDLLVPPLSLLIVLLILASCAAALIALLTHGDVDPGDRAVLEHTRGARLRLPRLAQVRPHDAAPASLLAAISYVAWKLPMYCMFFIRPEKQWVRTARTPTPPSSLPTSPAKSPA